MRRNIAGIDFLSIFIDMSSGYLTTWNNRLIVPSKLSMKNLLLGRILLFLNCRNIHNLGIGGIMTKVISLYLVFSWDSVT